MLLKVLLPTTAGSSEGILQSGMQCEVVSIPDTVPAGALLQLQAPWGEGLEVAVPNGVGKRGLFVAALPRVQRTVT